jgi:hypothetical protein
VVETPNGRFSGQSVTRFIRPPPVILHAAYILRVIRARVVLGLLGAIATTVVIAWDPPSRRAPSGSTNDLRALRETITESQRPGPTVGTPAPPFSLPPIDGGAEVTLDDFRGRPVVLVFGSFTCNLFCDRLDQVRELVREYGERVPFVFVYVRDAGHPPPSAEPLSRYQPELPEPERRRLIADLWNATGVPVRCVFGSDTSVQRDYGGFPLRLVVIDGAGHLAFSAGRDWDFAAVRRRLDECVTASTGTTGTADQASTSERRRE